MNKLKELIEWMESELNVTSLGQFKNGLIYAHGKAKSLQEEEPRMYTQEEIDKAWEEGFKRGLNQCQEGAILIGEPFRK